jgi:glycerol-3-phosphate acyltransferase PlsY
MWYPTLAILGYFLGSLPTGVVLSRFKYGVDVREMGSGNIGATNVTRVFGWYAGFLTFTLDFVKGLVPLLLTRHFLPKDPWLTVVLGISLVLGHCYSIYLRFRGGKGVATSLGVLSVALPWAALAAFVTYFSLVILTRISAVGSLGGVLAVLLYCLFFHPSFPNGSLIIIVCLIIVLRHRSNIKRLVVGAIRGRK